MHVELTQDIFDRIRVKALDLMRKRQVRCNCNSNAGAGHSQTCSWRLNADGCWDEAEQVIKKEDLDG